MSKRLETIAAVALELGKFIASFVKNRRKPKRADEAFKEPLPTDAVKAKYDARMRVGEPE